MKAKPSVTATMGPEIRVGQPAKPARQDWAASGSPSQPSASEHRVTPSCTAGKSSSMPRCRRRTARAPGTCAASICSIARFADGDQRKLGSHKKCVGQNQHGHGDKFEQGKAVHLAAENSTSRRPKLKPLAARGPARNCQYMEPGGIGLRRSVCTFVCTQGCSESDSEPARKMFVMLWPR